MTKRAFIFTGQGEKLELTNPQLSTFWTSISLAKILIANDIKPDALAGLSLGELSCYAIANVFSIEELEAIIQYRQNAMDEALSKSNTCMLACIGPSANEIETLIKNYDNITITNYNSPTQVVVGGRKEQIDAFKTDLLKLNKTTAVILPTIGAFHSAYLEQASEQLSVFLKPFEPKNPSIPIYYNLTGNSNTPDIKDNLAKHVSNPVQFQAIIENMLDDGVSEFISIGIGTTPVNLIRQICKEKRARATIKKVESLDDIRGLLA